MINLRPAKRWLAQRHAEFAQLFFRFTQQFHRSFELPERYRQRISERNIHITLFPYFFTSLPHYFALESRYNSYAIPAFQDCLPGGARCRRNSQPSSSPSPIG